MAKLVARSLVVIFIGVYVGAALGVFTGHGDLAAQEIAPLDVREIAPGVYAHQAPVTIMDAASGGDIGNNGFIVGDDAVAVIDTGGAPIIGERLKKAIEKITAKPIRYVINTHEHPDYTFGNVAFVAPGVTFVGHRNLPRSLARARPALYPNPAQGYGRSADRRRQADPSDAAGRCREGHAPRSWASHHRFARLAAEGYGLRSHRLRREDFDVVRGRSFVFAARPGGRRECPRLAQGYSSVGRHSGPAWRPGHGPVGVAWPQALDAEKAYLQKLTEDVRAILAKGEDINIAARNAGQSEASKWHLFGVYNARNATAVYAELEWE